MPLPKLTRLELQIMETLWSKGVVLHSRVAGGISQRRTARLHDYSDRCLPARSKEGHTAYEQFLANAHVFEVVVSRDSAQHRMIDDLVALFGCDVCRS